MGITNYLQIMEANGLLIRPKPCFYIYKLVCSLTGQYYIGRTKDLDFRVGQHIQKIVLQIEGSDNCQLPCYKKFAEVIQEVHVKTKSKRSIQNFVMRNCSIDLMAVVQDLPTADIIECRYINEARNDTLCLNSK